MPSTTQRAVTTPNHTQVWPLNGGNLKWVAYFNNGVLNDCSGLIEDTHRNDTIEVTHTSVTPPLDNLQVTFDYQAPGEIANENVSVKPGDTVTAPDMTNKTREDYTFGGWYTDSACTDGKEFNFSTPITESMTLNAKWTPKEQKATYTVHYYLENSTTKVANDRVVSDAKGRRGGDGDCAHAYRLHRVTRPLRSTSRRSRMPRGMSSPSTIKKI